MRHFSKDDLEGKGATKGTFAIAIVIKGADAIDSTTMAFAMDTSKVINASYLNPTLLEPVAQQLQLLFLLQIIFMMMRD